MVVIHCSMGTKQTRGGTSNVDISITAGMNTLDQQNNKNQKKRCASNELHHHVFFCAKLKVYVPARLFSENLGSKCVQRGSHRSTQRITIHTTAEISENL